MEHDGREHRQRCIEADESRVWHERCRKVRGHDRRTRRTSEPRPCAASVGGSPAEAVRCSGELVGGRIRRERPTTRSSTTVQPTGTGCRRSKAISRCRRSPRDTVSSTCARSPSSRNDESETRRDRDRERVAAGSHRRSRHRASSAPAISDSESRALSTRPAAASRLQTSSESPCSGHVRRNVSTRLVASHGSDALCDRSDGAISRDVPTSVVTSNRRLGCPRVTRSRIDLHDPPEHSARDTSHPVTDPPATSHDVALPGARQACRRCCHLYRVCRETPSADGQPLNDE
jgi:hypothetical protein